MMRLLAASGMILGRYGAGDQASFPDCRKREMGHNAASGSEWSFAMAFPARHFAGFRPSGAAPQQQLPAQSPAKGNPGTSR